MDEKGYIQKERDTLLVSYDFSGDPKRHLVVVGRKEGGYLDIVNAFEGDRAHEVIDKLVTQIRKEDT